MRFVLLMLLSCIPLPLFAQAPRTAIRPLFTFENAQDVSRLSKLSENSTLIVVQDNGVTEGTRCGRWSVPRGADYGVLKLDPTAIKNWRDFDYFAIDVTIEDDYEYPIVLELWDAASKNYATRCTFEGVTTRAGRQTLYYPINRAKRNGKEGREWEELEPKDKIDLNGLTQVKLFTTPRKDRDFVVYIDQLRLMQEDAAKPKLNIPLPGGALAFNFGSAGATTPGFTTIPPTHPGWVSSPKLSAGGDGKPDLLAGTFISGLEGQTIQFRTPVPAGTYHYYLIGGPIYRTEPADLHYRLTLGEVSILDQKPTIEEYLGDDYLYRFLKVNYSERPHALWDNYLNRMYPTHTGTVKVGGPTLTLTARNLFVSTLILIPEKADFDGFVRQTTTLRRDAFEKSLRSKEVPPLEKGNKSVELFVPDEEAEVRPHTPPGKNRMLDVAVAPGQRVTVRVAVTPYVDLANAKIEVVGVKWVQPRIYWETYRYDGDRLTEMALLPSASVPLESGITRAAWIWFSVPPTAPVGVHNAQVRLVTDQGVESVALRFEIEATPLEDVLPLSLGMYYSPRLSQGLEPNMHRRLITQQLALMREVGFTATDVGRGTVVGVDGQNHCRIEFDPMMSELARAAGMGRHPKQFQMGGTLGLARSLARRLPGTEGPTVDRTPGIEFTQPRFRPAFMDALAQYRRFIEAQKLPVAVEIVDEPREVPNPWNRNLADTLRYAEMVREAGLTTFVTPMGDRNGGKDYSILADHVDIISVHATPSSANLIARTRERDKRLWFYNTGMDRLSWGFYNWKMGSTGRWEWHFNWHEDGPGYGGYLGSDPFNPFTRQHGMTSYAPLRHPGGMLFTSAFFRVHEGINDSIYLHTLQTRLIAARGNPNYADAVKQGDALLATIRAKIPDFPTAQGLDGADAGALVGQGLKDPVSRLATPWRREIARILKSLPKPS